MSARRPAAFVLALAVLGGLCACSHTGREVGSSAAPSAGSPLVNASTSPAAAGGVRSVIGAPSFVAPKLGRSSCRRSALQVTMRLAGGAASQTESIIVLTNHGREACTVEGYPRIAAFGRIGNGRPQRLDLKVQDGGTYFAADPGPHPVTLTAGGSASSTMETFLALAYRGPADDAVATQFTVTPPGSGSPLVTVPYRLELTRSPGQPFPVVVTALMSSSNGATN
jgi:hypothetical protein